MRTAATLIVLVFLAAPVAALSPDENTLYGHSDADDTTQWMNTVEVEGDGTSTGPCGSAVGAGTACTQESFEVVFVDDPPISQSVLLDLEGTAEVTVHLGGGFASGGQFDVSMQLRQGDTVILDGEAKEHTYTPKPPSGNVPDLDPYETVTWSLSPLVDTIEAGVPLEWVIQAEGQGSNPYVSTSEARGQSRMTLPVLAVLESQAENATLNETFLDLEAGDHAFLALEDVPFGDHIVYADWTATQDNLTLEADVTGNGTVRLLLDDGNTTMSFDLPHGITEAPLTDLSAGEWTIQLSALNFTGNVTVLIEPIADDDDGDAPDGGDPGDAGDDGADNGTDEPADDEDSPAPALLLLPVLGLVAWLRRR